MRLHDFDKIYCINLKKRTDRKITCDKIFKLLRLNVEYIEAVDGSMISSPATIKPGHKGCCLSHRNIYNIVRNDPSLQKVLILEDDIEFHPEVEKLFKEWYEEVPDHWNMLYFGGNHNGLEKNFVKPHVHRLIQTYTTHCYAIKREIVPQLLAEFSDENIYNNEVDVHLSKVQKEFPCYGFFPHLGWQRESFSDIEMKNKRYDFLR